MQHCVGKVECGLQFSKKACGKGSLSLQFASTVFWYKITGLICGPDGRICPNCQDIEFCMQYNDSACKSWKTPVQGLKEELVYPTSREAQLQETSSVCSAAQRCHWNSGSFSFHPCSLIMLSFSSWESQDICHKVRNKREEECTSHAGPMLAKKAEAFSDPVPTPSPEAPATFHLGLINQQRVLWLQQQTGRLRMQVLPLTFGPPSRSAFPYARCRQEITKTVHLCLGCQCGEELGQQSCTWEKDDIDEEECRDALYIYLLFKWTQSITPVMLPSLLYPVLESLLFLPKPRPIIQPLG